MPEHEAPERRRERAVEIVAEFVDHTNAPSTTAQNIVRELIDAGLIVDDLGKYYAPPDRVAAGKAEHRRRYTTPGEGDSMVDRVAVIETRIDDIERTLQTIAEGFTR